MILGFLLAIAFNPFTFTGATSPRWALLAVALPFLCLRSPPGNFTITHLLGLVFIAWASITLIWTANLWDGLAALILIIILTSAFVYGTRLQSLNYIFTGMALGISVSSLILIIPPLHNLPSIVLLYPHGLFGNRNMLAEVAVLTALGCLAYKQYWYIPGLLPAIFWQPITRGAILAGLAGFGCWLWPRSKTLTAVLAGAVCIAALAAYSLDYRIGSVDERLAAWQAILSHITLSGHGLGSLYTLSPYLTDHWDTTVQRLDHAHNEAIEVLFELGIIGLAAYIAIIAIALGSAAADIRIVLVGFLVISCVAFPWHIPANAFIGALCLGHAVRHGAALRWRDFHWRSILRLGLKGGADHGDERPILAGFGKV
jgi:O-antigen ligase